jgi:hypothetical protein
MKTDFCFRMLNSQQSALNYQLLRWNDVTADYADENGFIDQTLNNLSRRSVAKADQLVIK